MIYKVFNTNQNKYLYDRQENRIIKIDDAEYLCFLELEKGNINDKNEKVVGKFQKLGFCKENKLEIIEHPYSSSLEFYLNERVEQVTLQVTQNCNLRCEYCTYSGKYRNRIHTKKRMDYETACKAIDFLIKHSRSTPKSTVGFYGGEPLLEITLIKNVITYIENNYEGKKFSYSMTTNGTLLSDDIVDYLVEKNFTLMISIDGPKNIHDSNRCFENGKGSYDLVIKNLGRMKERYPEYYKKCTTNTVLSPTQDCTCVEAFLQEDDVMKSLSTKISLISDTGSNQSTIYDDTVLIEQRKMELQQMLIMLGEIKESSEKTIYGDYKQELYRKYTILNSGCMYAKKGHPGGPCITGGKKTFVDIEGNIYPCEKVPECKDMSIGNIDTGISIEKAQGIMNIARITEQQCKNCWAFIFCSSCVAASINEDGISAEKRLSKCNREKIGAIENLKNITRLQEYGYTFDEFY